MLRRMLLLASVVIFVGCAPDQSSDQPTAATESTEPTMVGDVSTEIVAKLALADEFDGASDHQIGKCYVCGLGMDGKPEFAVEVEGYTAHLCSDYCREQFANNWQSVVAETDIPESK